MNYIIRSINPTSIEDSEFVEEPVEILGSLYTLQIETTYNECLVILDFLCGAKSGVYRAKTRSNTTMLKAYPNFPIQTIIETLSYEFPYIIDHNMYAEHAKKATSYLQANNQHAVQNGTAVHIELPNDILVNLTRRDILYFADLEDEINTKEN